MDVYWQVAAYVTFLAQATQVAASVLVLILTFLCPEGTHATLFDCSAAIVSNNVFTF